MASLDSDPDMSTEPVRENLSRKYAKLAKTSPRTPFLSYSILASFAIFARDIIFSHAGPRPALRPELLARQFCTFYKRLELRPLDRWMHLGTEGTLGKAAVRAGKHIFPTDESG